MTVLFNSAADCHFTGSRALRHNLSNALPKYEFENSHLQYTPVKLFSQPYGLFLLLNQ